MESLQKSPQTPKIDINEIRDTKMFPSELLLIKWDKDAVKRFKKFAEENNYAFLDMILDLKEA